VSRRLTPGDLAAIGQVVALFPHAFARGGSDALAAVFTPDAVIELTRGPGALKVGLAAISEFAAALAGDGPEHHTLDTVAFVGDYGVVRARSRYLALLPDQSVHNGDYLDTFVDTPGGWRISRRISVPRFPRGEQRTLPQETLDAWSPVAAGRGPF
jgi:hypothetical protein